MNVHENKESGVHVTGLREDVVTTPNQVMDLLMEGEEHRHVGETKMNKLSSRSHTIFRMMIESRSKNSEEDGSIRVSALTLVDLAGSERVSKTGADGQRMKEGAAINKSLLTLGTVINKLSEGSGASGAHIPYRDSKLTRILQPSLGGNAKTAIICAITPACQHVEESHSTLRFACRAKRVVNNVTVNEVLSDAIVMKRQADEIEELRKKLGADKMGSIEMEILKLREQMLNHENFDCIQDKVEYIARLLMKSVSQDAGSFKKRKVTRRETCPGILCGRKSSLGVSDCYSPDASQRMSDGDILLKSRKQQISCMGQPPDDIDFSEITDPEELKVRLREVSAANKLMQREVESLTQSVKKHHDQMKDTEDKLIAITEERDGTMPVLKEAQWRVRHLEKDMTKFKNESDQALQSFHEAEEQIKVLQEEKNLAIQEAEEARRSMQAQLEQIKAQSGIGASSSLELIEAQADVEKLQNKCARVQADEALARQKAEQLQDEVDAVTTKLSDALESCKKAEAKNTQLSEEIERLKSHIGDLEKRKRAPLYQKKQEQELKAVSDMAKEAERRAEEAERREAQVREELEDQNSQIKQHHKKFDSMKRDYEEKILDLTEEIKAMTHKLSASVEQTSSKQVELLANARADAEQSKNKMFELEQAIEEKVAVIKNMSNEMKAMTEKCDELTAQVEEAQACADAAAAHVRFLEEKAECEAISFGKEKEEMEQRHQDELKLSEEANKELEKLLENAKLENEAIQEVNKVLEVNNSELEGRIKFASSTINAVDELRDLKRKHKDEVARLNLALKTASAGSRGSEKAADRASKETERLKKQLKEAESKLRAAAAGRSSAQSEKAAIERELRTAKAQVEKLNKTVKRIGSVEERKREGMALELKEAREKISAMQQELDNTKATLQASEEEVATANSNYTVAHDTIVKLEASLEEYRKRVDELEEKVDNYSANCNTKEQTLAQQAMQITDLEDSLNLAHSTSEQLHKNISELKQSIEKEVTLKKELEEQRQELEKKTAELVQSLEDTTQKLSHLLNVEVELEKSMARITDLETSEMEMENELKVR